MKIHSVDVRHNRPASLVRRQSSRIVFICRCILVTGMLALGQSSATAEQPSSPAPAIAFDDFFIDKALRLELFQFGNATESEISLHQIFEEPVWPENPSHLLTPFDYGRTAIKVYDATSNTLIFSKGFDTMFSEYATTDPAIKGTKRVFETVARCPFPKSKIRVEIEERGKDNVLSTVLTTIIDPADYQIRRESVLNNDEVFEIQNTGHPHDRLDVVFLAEGYTADESKKFRDDVKRMTEFLFSKTPYSALKDKFSVRAIFRPSAEKGADEPRQGIFKSTALNATYNIFDLDRYLLVEENHAMHRIAALVPYDTVVVLVNTPRYGGGAICLDYCVCSADDPLSPLVFLHEFGHSLSYLADEYVGAVSYNGMYPEGVEPIEPNITRELDREKIKWKSMLTPDVSLPTVDSKAELRQIAKELNADERVAKKKIEEAEASGRSAAEIDAIRTDWTTARELLEKQQQSLQSQSDNLQNVVGAFEGGGYAAKGIFRPEQSCWMGSNDADAGLCIVCCDAVRRMVLYYADDEFGKSKAAASQSAPKN